MYPTGFNPNMLCCSLLLKNSLWMATGWGIFRHQVQFQPDKPPVEAPCQHERLHFSYPCKRHKPGRAQGSTILLGKGFPPKGTPRVPLTGLVPAGRRVLQLGPAHEITAPRVILWEWSSDLVLFCQTSNNVAIETREKKKPFFLSFQTRFRTPNYSVSNRKLSGGVRTAGCVVRRETLLVWQGAGRLVSLAAAVQSSVSASTSLQGSLVFCLPSYQEVGVHSPQVSAHPVFCHTQCNPPAPQNHSYLNSEKLTFLFLIFNTISIEK